MTSILKVDKVTNTATSNGFSIDPVSGQLRHEVNGFVLVPDAFSITVPGKTKAVFKFVATDQSWVVPAGVNYIFVKMWGAGGAGGHYGGWSYGSRGGAGGYSRGLVQVFPGETLTIRVPRGGLPLTGATPNYFGGGATNTGSSYCGQGGGYVGLFRGTTPLMIAGGGGSGGSITTAAYQKLMNGGAGGGLIGQDGTWDSYNGGAITCRSNGGTQTAGGVAPIGTTTGGAGSYLQGGSHVTANDYGGGGGGGYYGGSSGCQSLGSAAAMQGGAGGSGYINPSSVIYGTTIPGRDHQPGMFQDPDYPAGFEGNKCAVAEGGFACGGGGDGYMMFFY